MSDQYLRLLKSVIKALDALKASLDQYVNTRRENQQTTHNQNQQQSPIEVRTEFSLPVPVREYYEAEQRERQSAWRKIKTGLEIVGIGAAVVLAVLTYFTLRKVSSQAESAKTQVSIMQRQLETTDRPWIRIIGATITDGLGFYRTVDKGLPGAHASIKIVAKNIGRSVAVHVKMTGWLIFEFPWDTNDTIWDRERAICSTADISHTTSEFTLFPEESTGDRLAGQLGCGGYELIPPDAFWQTEHESKWIDPVFAGCISYQIGGSSERLHHTGFLYEFAVKRGDAPASADRLFRFGDKVPAERLVMVEHPFGFSDAN